MKKIAQILLLMVAAVMASKAAFAEDPLLVGPDVYQLISENDRVRIMSITFAPGAKIATHSHPDHIAVIVTGGTLTLSYPDGSTKELAGEPGQAFYIPAEAHAAENTGTTEVKGVVIELKEGAAGEMAAVEASPEAEAAAEAAE